MTERQLVLTAEGLKKIEEELRLLQTVRRQEIAEQIRQAKDLGDVAENTEYEAAKTEQAFLEGRISELKGILMSSTVIDASQVPTNEIGIGSVVRVRDLDAGEDWEFRMVGSFEADPEEDRISFESPIGQALLHRKVGDVVEVKTPGGLVRFEVLEIRRPEA